MYNQKSMIVNLKKTDPQNWRDDISPELSHQTDAIIYEVDVRDFTSSPNSDLPKAYRGKYLGFTVHGANYDGITTGIDHLKSLGLRMFI